MARVEDGGEANTGLEGLYHDAVHFIVDNVAGHSEVDRVDDLIVAIFLVAVKILGLTAVTWKPTISQGYRQGKRIRLPE